MTCTHRETYGENVQLPAEVSLEHFDQCTTQETRLTVWKLTNTLAEIAGRCIRNDHEGQIEHLQNSFGHQRAVRRARWRSYNRRTRTRTRSRR